MDRTVLYFQNLKGKVAISLNLGESVIIPNGRTISLDHTSAWEEVSEDLEKDLSDIQIKKMEEFLNRPPPGELENMADVLGRGLRDLDRRTKAKPLEQRIGIPNSALVVCSDFD